ncbi:hypothetical protein EYF80_019166 [Liparis tanakae]|uniref:Uncharacterized protein n=1 Tax=Liparis tanakae TaxID=230148 RepID=A0A4Z2I025_9TELE|nr:hypothetical protein EYF80_019166 [Liparis tanakae]
MLLNVAWAAGCSSSWEEKPENTSVGSLQRDVVGLGVLGLWLCIGFMEEFKLLRTAFGAAELSEWDAVAPRKPERNRKEGAGDERRDIIQANHTLRSGLQKTGISSNCHQPESKLEEEFPEFLQGREC